MLQNINIAVLIPCYNEALTIADVIANFKTSLPQARIVVFDNASTDGTSQVAKAAGAEVIFEARAGKGNVVRRMFAEIQADIYIMVDGDGTYDASAAPDLVEQLIAARADMLIATRASVTQDAGRKGHAFGNKLFNKLYGMLFGQDYSDIFSGYRVFTNRFVKSFPALSRGFEIETEMAVHAAEMRMPVIEVELPYGRRPEGSFSKLSTFGDGFKILKTFFNLFRHTRPMRFFALCSSLITMSAFVLAYPLILTFIETGLVPRLPTAVLVMGMLVISTLMMGIGLVLENVTKGHIEQKRLAYLSQPNFYENMSDHVQTNQKSSSIQTSLSHDLDWQKLRQELFRSSAISQSGKQHRA